MNGITDFLGIGIVGTVLSLVFQYAKTTSGMKSKLWMAGLSVVIGTGYFFLRQTNYFETVLGVLASASTIYSLFLKQDEPVVPFPPLP
jgi:hypothetical protein